MNAITISNRLDVLTVYAEGVHRAKIHGMELGQDNSIWQYGFRCINFDIDKFQLNDLTI